MNGTAAYLLEAREDGLPFGVKSAPQVSDVTINRNTVSDSFEVEKKVAQEDQSLENASCSPYMIIMYFSIKHHQCHRYGLVA